jgi:hypothetical protein
LSFGQKRGESVEWVLLVVLLAVILAVVRLERLSSRTRARVEALERELEGITFSDGDRRDGVRDRLAALERELAGARQAGNTGGQVGRSNPAGGPEEGAEQS